MRYPLLTGVLAGLVVAGSAAAEMQTGGALVKSTPPNIAQAIADPARPQADRDLDAARKPAEVLTLIGVKPGQTVVDAFGGPYFDRLFAGAVGEKGQVIMFLPSEMVKAEPGPFPADASRPFPDRQNVVVMIAPTNSFAVKTPADVVFIRQNYHDLYDPFMKPADVPTFNKAVFKALKKGGLYVIIDHSAPDGSGLADTNTTHRIDAAAVKKDMTAAGFKFVRESNAYRNPADTRAKLVFDPSVRGKTDQFFYVFKKP